MKALHDSLTNRFLVFGFLSFIILAVYANTFYASWHLDDRPNIVENYYLHLDSLQPQKLIQTLFTNPKNPDQFNTRLYRPVACFTFALNWYFGQDNVIGYHLVNSAIHVLTAVFLFLFILSLFDTPNLSNKSRGNPIFIAFLATLLWALNPIQTQAVTYIVQRMAQLAALFYLMGLYTYVKARLSHGMGKQVVWFLSLVGFYLLAVYSKPNAAMLPMAIVLVEIAFFQNLADAKTRKKVVLSVFILAVLFLLSGSVLFLGDDPFSLLDLYDKRSFTVLERLLTQPRVVLFYLSQIFFPLPDRFSIAHDVVLSSSLFTPWTTLPCILIIALLIGIGVLMIGKWPILSFSILFFFFNHVIESSIIGLELIFEHRNYLPSFFLFLPAACLLDGLLRRYKTTNKVPYAATGCFILSLVVFFCVSTFIRNHVWKDDVGLWLDAVSKAPKHSRAMHNLAVNLAWGDSSRHPKRYDMALKLFEDALEKHLPSKHVKADIYGNMALIYFYRKNNPHKAFQYFDKALNVYPDYHKIRRDFVEALVVNRDFESALEQVDILISRNRENGRDLNLKGHILLWQKQYKDALACFKKAYPLMADKSSVLLNSAVAMSLAGSYPNAEKVLLEAIKQFPAEIPFYFTIIENSLRANAEDQAFTFAQELLKIYTIREINNAIDTYTDNPKFAPINAGPIRRVFIKVETKTADGN